MVLGGDCAQVIGLLTGARRYYKHLNLLWMDRDADLNTPASTPSGRIDGMVVARIIGKGAPELVRFWGEPPARPRTGRSISSVSNASIRPNRNSSQSRRCATLAPPTFREKVPPPRLKEALAHLHTDSREFVLHLDTDIIAQEEFPAVNVPAEGGLPLADVKAALTEALRSTYLVGLTITQYNPDKDPDASAAKKLVDLLVEALSVRLNSGPEAAPQEPATILPEISS